MPVRNYDLNPVINGSLATGVYAQIFSQHDKRRFAVVQCLPSSPVNAVIVIAKENPTLATAYARVVLVPGGHIVFSPNDFDWDGAIWGTGDAGTATIYGMEVVDY